MEGESLVTTRNAGPYSGPRRDPHGFFSLWRTGLRFLLRWVGGIQSDVAARVVGWVGRGTGLGGGENRVLMTPSSPTPGEWWGVRRFGGGDGGVYVGRRAAVTTASRSAFRVVGDEGFR